MSSIMDHEVWGDVEEALSRALTMTWDGCHKIYLAMDDEQVARSTEYGYDQYPPNLEMLQEWFEQSCGLRFVDAVHTNHENPNAGFVDLIPQFYFEDLEGDDEEDDD